MKGLLEIIIIKFLRSVIKSFYKGRYLLLKPFWQAITYLLLKAFNIQHSSIYTNGIPYISCKNGGSISIGNKFKLNNGFYGNIIGRQQRCILIANRGKLVIGNSVGMSSTAIICQDNIKIGNNVKIGGNTVIYDSDFHSLNPYERKMYKEDLRFVSTKPVIIEDGVFIGGHCLILKGVSIGENSVIGAGSVVSKSIPSNEIWAGNPAKKIKEVK